MVRWEKTRSDRWCPQIYTAQPGYVHEALCLWLWLSSLIHHGVDARFARISPFPTGSPWLIPFTASEPVPCTTRPPVVREPCISTSFPVLLRHNACNISHVLQNDGPANRVKARRMNSTPLCWRDTTNLASSVLSAGCLMGCGGLTVAGTFLLTLSVLMLPNVTTTVGGW